MDKNMMKGIIIGFMVITIGACSNLGNLIPNKFDNVEYGSLVRLGVIAENTKECNETLVITAWGESAFLEKYAKYTMNETNQKIYVKINDLVEELKDREDPTPAYCRIKWGNISKVVEEALSVSGSRQK